MTAVRWFESMRLLMDGRVCTPWNFSFNQPMGHWPERSPIDTTEFAMSADLNRTDELQAHSPISNDDVRTCVRVLSAIDADRSLLTRLSQSERRELITAAGRVAKPERHNLVKMAKAFRRADRAA